MEERVQRERRAERQINAMSGGQMLQIDTHIELKMVNKRYS